MNVVDGQKQQNEDLYSIKLHTRLVATRHPYYTDSATQTKLL
jgi:hypothetical protein